MVNANKKIKQILKQFEKKKKITNFNYYINHSEKLPGTN